MDWKDQLSAFAENNGLDKAQETEKKSVPPNLNLDRADSFEAKSTKSKNKGTLYIRFEKRNGKPATIISEFSGTDDELKDLAKSIKTKMGIGGSAKDDEILLQGDVRKKVAALLRDLGYKLKGEV